MASGRIGLFAHAHLYLALIVGWLWRLSAPGYLALWPLVAAFYSAFVAGSYVLFRQFAPAFRP